MIILCTSVFCHTHLSTSVRAYLSQCVSGCWDVVSHVGKKGNLEIGVPPLVASRIQE